MANNLLAVFNIPNTKFLSIPKIEILGWKWVTWPKPRLLGVNFSSDDEVLDINVQNLERVRSLIRSKVMEGSKIMSTTLTTPTLGDNLSCDGYLLCSICMPNMKCLSLTITKALMGPKISRVCWWNLHCACGVPGDT